MEHILIENDLIGKQGHILNVDETGLQLNNRPGHVIAKKGSTNIAGISSGEKGGTITVISCCNAVVVFIPPTYVRKSKNKEQDFEDGMPPGFLVCGCGKSRLTSTVTYFFNGLKYSLLSGSRQE